MQPEEKKPSGKSLIPINLKGLLPFKLDSIKLDLGDLLLIAIIIMLAIDKDREKDKGIDILPILVILFFLGLGDK